MPIAVRVHLEFLAASMLAAGLPICGCPASSNDFQARCNQAKNKGIDFLAANQQETGGFPSQWWRTTDPVEKRMVATPFTVSQVLYSLTFCADNPTAGAVSKRAVNYLLAQMEPPGVLRYFGKTGLVSPDVDDTAMAWAALKRTGHPIAREALEAVRASRNKEGLFNTWIGDPSTWTRVDSREIDAVVNLNALLIFGSTHESFGDVCNYLLTQADGEAFRRGTVYYSPMMFAYAFSRAYADGQVSCLQKAVPQIRDATVSLQQSDGGWGDDLETALGALTLLNLSDSSQSVQRGMQTVLARQTPDGGWALTPAYSGDSGRLRYGSRAMTSALCVEALAKYLKK
jgi:hypothetical protein